MENNTVLFVDDQKEILFLIKRMLKDEPYLVLFANSAEEALEIVEKDRVDVIVTDVLMPDMSGLELLDIIKESHPDIVRIILSGFSQVPTLLSAINHGKIFRYITKPWQVDEEAKEILREAIDYSNLLRNNKNAVGKNAPGEAVSVEELASFLDQKGEAFIVAVKGHTTHVHSSLKDKIGINELLVVENLEKFGEVESFKLTENIEVCFFT